MLTDFSTVAFSWDLLPLKNIYCSNNGLIYCICLIFNHRQHSGVPVFYCKQMLPPAEVLPINFVFVTFVIDQQTEANCYMCQIRISADQYHLTVPRAQVPTHRGLVLFWSYPLTNYQFQMIAGSSLFFPMIHMKYVTFMSLWPRTFKILISNWRRTRKFSHFF